MEQLEHQPITIQEYRKRVNKLTCKIPELAEILDISKEKARRLTHIEGFPCIRVGRDIRIILSKLDEWLSEHVGEVL